jgi:aquaporin Z
MKKYLAEALGTFVLVLCGTGAIVVDGHTNGALGGFVISLAFGLAVTTMIKVFGTVSGSHINPAVTMALWYHGSFPGKKVAGFIAGQLAGAFAASAVLHLFFPDDKTLGATLPSVTNMQAFGIEVFLMFALMLVILLVSQTHTGIKNYPGIIIGMVVFLEAYFGGPFTGASMNPARSIAPAVVSGETDALWIYIAAPLAGAFLAVFFFERFRAKKTA